MRRAFVATFALGVAVCAAAPALAQLDASKIEIRTTPLANGVYMLAGAGGNIGMSVGDHGVILIDDQYAPLTDKIKFAIAQVTERPVLFVINTHWHADHTGGNEKLAGDGALIVAHDNVRTRMGADQFSEVLNRTVPARPAGALPVVTFSENMSFHLNGQDIRIFHVENAHTDADAIVHFRDRNVIHMGDCFWSESYPLIDSAGGGSLRGMIRAANEGLALADGTTKIIPGHGRIGNREDLRAYRDMLLDVQRRVEPLVVAGRTADEIARARPLADLDAKWGGGFMTPERFLAVVVADLSR
jgi:glyoxylase-like metal-dependent hydrolase (beta-lactamase superfamily II)